MTYVTYDRISGEINSLLSCPVDMLDMNIGAGESVIMVDYELMDSTHWVEHETGTVHLKGDYALDALPLPCTVTIEGVEYHCTEQPEFAFDAPGSYTIAVDAGPRYLRKEFTLENPA